MRQATPRDEAAHEVAGGHDPSAAVAEDTLDAARLALVARSTENVTHEMNNLLMSLANYAEIAAMPQVTPEQRASHLGRISGLVDELADQVRVLRSVAVEGGGEAVRVDLAKLVRKAVSAARSGLRHAGVSLESQLHEGPLPVVVRQADLLHSLVAHLLAAAETVAGPTRPGEKMPRVAIELRTDHDTRAVVAIRASSGASVGVAPSVRAFEFPRALAVRAGAASSVGIDAAAGSVLAQLTMPLDDAGAATR